MASVTLVYGTTMGSTGEVAELLARELGDVDVRDVSSVTPQDFLTADLLVLGTPTWDDGDLQQDWVSFLPQMDGMDLTGRKVALFGLGNAFSFPGQFANGLGRLHQKVVECGATVIGFWPVDGYTFQASDAVVDGQFCGLVLDQENDPSKTPERVRAWAAQIRREAGLA